MKYDKQALFCKGSKAWEKMMAIAKITIFPTDTELGMAAAQKIFTGIQDAENMGMKYVLGCPGGRSPRSTYRALSALLSKAGQSIKHLHVAMMDEYAVQLPNGEFRNVDERSHFSCRKFAFNEIRDVLNAGLEKDLQVPYQQVHVPNSEKPEEYEIQLRALGVDCFLLASGASDGHVAFNGRGTSRLATTRITTLTEETRRDNMHTFPEFTSLAEVPIFGVSVGPETIASVSKRAILLLQGEHKREAFRRTSTARSFDPHWPATVITECQDPQIFADSLSANSI